MDVFKPDLSGDRGSRCLGVGGVFDRVIGLKQLNQPLSCARSPLQLTPDLRERGHSARHHHRVDDKLHQGTGGHHIRADITRADPQNSYNARKGEEDHNRGQQRPDHDPALGRVIRQLCHFGERGAAGVFMGKGLNGLHRRQAFGGIAR